MMLVVGMEPLQVVENPHIGTTEVDCLVGWLIVEKLMQSPKSVLSAPSALTRVQGAT